MKASPPTFRNPTASPKKTPVRMPSPSPSKTCVASLIPCFSLSAPLCSYRSGSLLSAASRARRPLVLLGDGDGNADPRNLSDGGLEEDVEDHERRPIPRV